MTIYAEGIIWYVLLADCITYNILTWSKGKMHDRVNHWISDYFPLKKAIGLWYLVMMIWLGSALYRMQIIKIW